MHEYQIQVDTTGTAGSATGDFTTPNPVWGFIHRVDIAYNAGAPATTNVVVSYTLSNGNSVEVANVPTNATDLYVVPIAYETDEAGVDLLTSRLHAVMGGYITVALTGCDALTAAVDVSIQII